MCQMQKWLLVKQYPALYVRTFLLLLCYIVVIYALFMQVIIFSAYMQHQWMYGGISLVFIVQQSCLSQAPLCSGLRKDW